MCHLYNGETNKLETKLSGHDDIVHCVDFSPDEKFAVTGSRDKLIIIWCLETF